jgi:urease accessory protein UreE
MRRSVCLAVSLPHCELSMRRAIAVHRRGAWPEDAALDEVTLASVDRHRRRIRLVAASGQAYLLDLPRAHLLAEGDGLELEGGGYLRVSAAAEPLLEIAAASPADLLRMPGISAIGIWPCRSPASDCAFAPTM